MTLCDTDTACSWCQELFSSVVVLQAGRQSIPCTCSAMKDQVTLDMRMFDGGAMSISSTSDGSDDEEASSSDGPEPHAAPPAEKDVVGKKRTREPSHAAAAKAGRNADDSAPRRVGRQSCTSRAAAKPLRAAAVKLSAARKKHGQNEMLMSHLSKLAKPCAIVYGEDSQEKPFDLVVPLETAASSKAKVTLQALKQGKDGLYRPSSDVFEERRSSLVTIRTQLVDPGCRKPGFKLLTLRSRILGTELVG